MQPIEEWFTEYDSETLTKNFLDVDFERFPAYSEKPIEELANLEFSMIRIESYIQTYLVQQNKLLNSFFQTESICNESEVFQRFSLKILSFIKTELNYSLEFWKSTKLTNFVQNRLIASLLRTFRFLKCFHFNIIANYSIDIENEFYDENPNVNSVSDNVEFLLLRYQDLMTVVHYFQKSYSELYSKIEIFRQKYPLIVNLVCEILLYSKLFMTHNPRAIMTQIYSRLPSDTVKKLKHQLFKINEGNLKEIAENNREKSYSEELQNIEKYLVKQMASSSFLNKIVAETDQNSKTPAMALNRLKSYTRIDSAFKHDEDFHEPRKGTIFSGKFKNLGQKDKDASPKPDPRRDALKFDTEKKVDISTLTAFKNSPNNPFAHNSIMHSMMPDLIKSNSSILAQKNSRGPSMSGPSLIDIATNGLPIEEMSPLVKGFKKGKSTLVESPDYGSNVMPQNSTQKIIQENRDSEEFAQLLNSKFNDHLVRILQNGGKDPDEELRIQEEKSKQSQGVVSALLKKKSTMNFELKSLGTSSSTESNSNLKKKMTMSSNQGIQETNEENEKDKGDKKKKDLKKKQKEEVVELLPEDLILTDEELTYEAEKEERGEDVPDDQILGENMYQSGSSSPVESDVESLNPYSKKSTKKRIGVQETNYFIKYIHEKIKAEQDDPNSKYFGQRKNYLHLAGDNLNSWRFTNKWALLRDYLHSQVMIKSVSKLRAQIDPTMNTLSALRRDAYLKKYRAKQKSVAFNLNKAY